METKEEKKERRQGYFARLKKKRQVKQTTEAVSANSPGSPDSKRPSEKDDESKVILEQISSSEDNCKFPGEKETGPDKEKKKKKYNQLKDIRRTELKRYYSTDFVLVFCWNEFLDLESSGFHLTRNPFPKRRNGTENCSHPQSRLLCCSHSVCMDD